MAVTRLIMIRIALTTLLADQGSKFLALTLVEGIEGNALEVIPPLMNLQLAWNTGMNFGIFAQYAGAVAWAQVLLALAVSLGLAIWLWRSGPDASPDARPHIRPPARVAAFAGLLSGGALGNAVDRVLHGAVVDFINIGVWGWENPYQFNLADVAIVLGAFGLAICLRKGKEVGSSRVDTA